MPPQRVRVKQGAVIAPAADRLHCLMVRRRLKDRGCDPAAIPIKPRHVPSPAQRELVGIYRFGWVLKPSHYGLSKGHQGLLAEPLVPEGQANPNPSRRGRYGLHG